MDLLEWHFQLFKGNKLAKKKHIKKETLVEIEVTHTQLNTK